MIGRSAEVGSKTSLLCPKGGMRSSRHMEIKAGEKACRKSIDLIEWRRYIGNVIQ